MTQKQDLRERCFYLLTLFKAKNMALFEKYTAQLANTSAEESTEFYHYLMGEYKKLLEGLTSSQPQPQSQPQKPVPKTEATKPVVKKAAPAKKTAKKVVAKKKPGKKITKKVTKKVTKKKKK